MPTGRLPTSRVTQCVSLPRPKRPLPTGSFRPLGCDADIPTCSRGLTKVIVQRSTSGRTFTIQSICLFGTSRTDWFIRTLYRWPQAADEILEDMHVRSLRSRGNWLTWPFRVIDLSELSMLGAERRAVREAHKVSSS